MRPDRPRKTWLPLGLFLAILALVSQVALGAPALPDVAGPGAAAALGVLCQAGGGAPANPDAPHHHAPDCALCPLCAALSMPGAILASGPALPVPAAAPAARGAPPPPARAPPGRTLRLALPRGPPVFA